MHPFEISCGSPRGPAARTSPAHGRESARRSEAALLPAHWGDVAQGSRASQARDVARENSGGSGSGGLGYWEAVMSISICACGAGVTVFPKVMADTGFLFAPAVMMLCAFSMQECSYVVCRACDLAEKATGRMITSYEELAEYAGGSLLQKTLLVTKNTAFLSFVVVYMQFQTESIGTFFGSPKHGGCPPLTMIRFCIVMPWFWLLIMVRDIKQLARFNTLGVIAVIVQCASIVLGGIIERADSDACGTGHFADRSDCRWYSWRPRQAAIEARLGEDSRSSWFGILGKALSVCIFAFAILATVPSYRHSLADRRQAPGVWRTSFLIILVVYLAVMSAGYVGYGNNSPENVITGIREDYPRIGTAAIVSILFNLTVSSPIFTCCIMSAFESLGSTAFHTPFSAQNVAVRVALISALAVVSWALPYVLEVIGLVSSVFGVCNNLFFPNLFYYLSRGRSGDVAPQYPPTRWLLHAFIIVLALACLVFGVKGSLATLVEKIHEEASNTTICER